jgi:hypothetical protein
VRLQDPEVLEVLRDEPQLLAIADAVVETQPLRRRRHRLGPAAAGASAVAALVAFALVAPWENDARNPVIERALAAIGSGPVLHVKERSVDMRMTRVDLSSGRDMEIATERELWFDEQRGVGRVRIRRGGRLIRDGALSALESGGLSPASALGAAGSIRELLDRGEAEIVGEGRVDGRSVHWLRVTDVHEGRQVGTREIAVDRASYEPLLIRLRRDGTLEFESRLLVVEALPRRAVGVPLRPPRPERRYSSMGGGPISPNFPTPAQARAWLSRPALWAGPQFRGLPLSMELTIVGGAGRAVGMVYGYGFRPGRTAGQSQVRVMQMAGDDPVRASLAREFPPPPEGFVDVSAPRMAAGESRSPFWHGLLRRRGVWVSIDATSRDLLLAAARALRVIPSDA